MAYYAQLHDGAQLYGQLHDAQRMLQSWRDVET